MTTATFSSSSSSSLPRVGEPVWCQYPPAALSSSSSTRPHNNSDDDEDDPTPWWPAIRFPNVWTAYAVLHEAYLSHRDGDADPLARELFDEWTLFGLEHYVEGRHERPVLARLRQAPYLDLVLLPPEHHPENNNNDDDGTKDSSVAPLVKSFYEFFPTPQMNAHAAFKAAVQHLKGLLQSPAMHREVVRLPTTATTAATTTTSSPSPTDSRPASKAVAKVTRFAAGPAVTPHPQQQPPPPPQNQPPAATHFHRATSTTSGSSSSSTTSSASSLSRSKTIERAHTATADHDNHSHNVNHIPPIEGEPIQPHEPWERVWKKLEFSGYTKQPSARGPIYLKPGGSRRAPADVWPTIHALQRFCRQAYGWQGPLPSSPQQPDDEEEDDDQSSDESQSEVPTALYETEGDDTSTIRTESVVGAPARHRRRQPYDSPAVSALTGMTTPAHQRTHPQDPGKPLLSSGGGGGSVRSTGDYSVGDSVASDSTTAANRYWNDVMKPKGWAWKKGRGGREWHYIAPGKADTQGYRLGVDYFGTLKEAYYSETGRQEPARGRGARRRVTTAKSAPTKGKKAKKSPAARKASKFMRRLDQASTTPLTTATTKSAKSTPSSSSSSSSSAVGRTQRGRKKAKEALPIPKWSKIRKILAKHCGFSLTSHPTQVEYDGRLLNELEVGFVLLECGVPPVPDSASASMDLIHTWLRHLTTPALANPGFHYQTFLKPDFRRLKTALIKLEFSFSLDRLFLPGAPHTRHRQVHGEHYFLDKELDTLFVNHLRCQFTRYVPDSPTQDQFEALRNVRSWLAGSPVMEIPTFTTFPAPQDHEFWNRIHRAERVCQGEPARAVVATKTPRRSKEKPAVRIPSSPDDSVSSCYELPLWTEGNIQSVLTKLGYQKTSPGGYRHKQAEASWESLDELRDFVGQHGIYNYSSVEKKLAHGERRALFLWTFCRIVTPQEYLDRKRVPQLNEKEFQLLLCQAGWHRLDGKWYHPHARAGKRELGTNVFSDLEQVGRTLLIDETALNDNISEAEALQLRLWALHPGRISLEFVRSAKRRRARLDLQEVMLPDNKVLKVKKQTKVTAQSTTVAEMENPTVSAVNASVAPSGEEVIHEKDSLTTLQQEESKKPDTHDVEELSLQNIRDRNTDDAHMTTESETHKSDGNPTLDSSCQPEEDEEAAGAGDAIMVDHDHAAPCDTMYQSLPSQGEEVDRGDSNKDTEEGPNEPVLAESGEDMSCQIEDSRHHESLLTQNETEDCGEATEDSTRNEALLTQGEEPVDHDGDDCSEMQDPSGKQTLILGPTEDLNCADEEMASIPTEDSGEHPSHNDLPDKASSPSEVDETVHATSSMRDAPLSLQNRSLPATFYESKSSHEEDHTTSVEEPQCQTQPDPEEDDYDTRSHASAFTADQIMKNPLEDDDMMEEFDGMSAGGDGSIANLGFLTQPCAQEEGEDLDEEGSDSSTTEE